MPQCAEDKPVIEVFRYPSVMEILTGARLRDRPGLEALGGNPWSAADRLIIELQLLGSERDWPDYTVTLLPRMSTLEEAAYLEAVRNGSRREVEVVYAWPSKARIDAYRLSRPSADASLAAAL